MIADKLIYLNNTKLAIKSAIEAKGRSVGAIPFRQYADEINAIAQDPSIPVGVGQHLVTFYDFDGKVLKRQRVNTGENATAPAIPTHQYLTFAEWNNPFTNVQSDIDTGAIYNTTDGKTYLFITLTPVTGLAPTLFFSKNSTSLMTIDWDDGTTSTSTTSGNQSINHVYATVGDYIITVDNSAGGKWSAGQNTSSTKLFQGYENICYKIYIGNYVSGGQYAFYSNHSIEKVSTGTFISSMPAYYLSQRRIKHINYGSVNFEIISNQNIKNVCFKSAFTTIFPNQFYECYGLSKFIKSGALTSIAASAFYNCWNCKMYIFTETTPPTLANINAFTGINPICKIYVPDASVEAYKAATNWNNFSAYIAPLSQKPQSNE